MQYTYSHKVQYYETDQMGIVHHSNYIRWFEEARTDMMDNAGFGYAKMEEAGVISPVLTVECEYKTMTRFGESVVIVVEIKKYTGIRMEVEYKVFDSVTNELRSIGKTSHCFLNKEGKIVSLKRDYTTMHEKVKLMLEK
jgi:acyl-CoA thioester hydrolase